MGENLPKPICMDESSNDAISAVSDHTCSYEDLCRSHVEAYMRGADAYAHETHLSRRVSEWQDRLEPILLQQDSNPSFDIHDYGDRVISSIQRKHQLAKMDQGRSGNSAKAVQQASFASIANGLPPFEA